MISGSGPLRVCQIGQEGNRATPVGFCASQTYSNIHFDFQSRQRDTSYTYLLVVCVYLNDAFEKLYVARTARSLGCSRRNI